MRNLRSFRLSTYFCFAAVCASVFTGCYSFSGASVPQHWSTIAISLFDDESNFGQPSLREQLTNTLIQKIQRDNTLRLGERPKASVELSGSITAITADQPIALFQGTQANRLQVSVRVSAVLYDNVLKKQAWKKDFNSTGDYSASGGVQERDAGIRKALDKITDDLLLEIVSAW
jgi:hypothetical protein